MVKPRLRRRGESGSVLLESLGGIVLLCLIFFGLLQIFRWAQAKMVSEYASFYVASSQSLGYTNAFSTRVGRVAAVGASGREQSSRPIRDADRWSMGEALSSYLSNPASSGIDFEYWDPPSDSSPHLQIWSGNVGGNTAVGRVWVERMPLLHESLAPFVGGANFANIPAGETLYYNYSKHYLDE